MKGIRRLWLGIALLILISPLGLYIPAKFGAGTAWGEWSSNELEKLIGYVPAGLRKAEELWKPPLPDYGPRAEEPISPAAAGAHYIVSAAVGASMVVAVTMMLGRLLTRRDSEKSGLGK